MSRENPHHPGETLLEDCIKALHLTIADAAKHLRRRSRRRWRQSASAAPRVTADMAVRFEHAFGGGPQTHWLGMQAAHDLSQARKSEHATSSESNRAASKPPTVQRGPYAVSTHLPLLCLAIATVMPVSASRASHMQPRAGPALSDRPVASSKLFPRVRPTAFVIMPLDAAND